ncbi:hypothetical protein ACFYYB_35310 [Streptomyces sp. NPDC002886]|uniref:hypothetical protein n=1 Tax=Streptomyces sp. NPDC002886 TaxID=3364667 RepID=UPI0036B8A401
MRIELPKPLPQPLAILVLATASIAGWAAWLGWDQLRDVQPDGSQTGPYQPWQVIGLVLTLLALVCWAASRHYEAAAVLGTTTGLTVAASYDWSDDGSGLFVIGVIMIMIGNLTVTGLLAPLIAFCARHQTLPRSQR